MSVIGPQFDADQETRSVSSLKKRMQAARDKRERRTTEDFPVPGWGSMCWVQLGVVPSKVQEQVGELVRRQVRGTGFNLALSAEMLVRATRGFYEVDEQDGETLHPVETSWNQLAHEVLNAGLEITPRQALIRLVGDERVQPFYGEYLMWVNGERAGIDEEQDRDFPATE